MLKLNIDSKEFYVNDRFLLIPKQDILLEHSLSSVYEWESKWHKPFLSKDTKTSEEVLDYLNMMVVEADLKGLPVYYILNDDLLNQIDRYISDTMTATFFNEPENISKRTREVITSEIIYFWMTTLNIPFECDKWHLNKLLTLIKVCSIKNAPSKKMSKQDIFRQNQALNASRKLRLGTKG